MSTPLLHLGNLSCSVSQKNHPAPLPLFPSSSSILFSEHVQLPWVGVGEISSLLARTHPNSLETELNRNQGNNFFVVGGGGRGQDWLQRSHAEVKKFSLFLVGRGEGKGAGLVTSKVSCKNQEKQLLSNRRGDEGGRTRDSESLMQSQETHLLSYRRGEERGRTGDSESLMQK